MKRLCILFLTFSCVSAVLCGQVPAQPPVHEIRVGWGDMGFEKASFRDSQQNTGYRYAGHFFAGYRYSFYDWLSVGFDADFSNISWMAGGKSGHNCQNIALLPSVRFTYFDKGIVKMYGGLGLGVDINTGTEVDFMGRRTIAAPALNPVLYGISLNWKNWFGAFELGGLFSARSKNEIFLLGSRIISVSIGIRL